MQSVSVTPPTRGIRVRGMGAWRPMPPNQASHPLPQYKVSWGAPVRRPLGDQGGRGPPAPAGLLLSSIRAQRNSIELPACVGICCEREAWSWRCRDLVYMGWFRGSSLMFWIQSSRVWTFCYSVSAHAWLWTCSSLHLCESRVVDQLAALAPVTGARMEAEGEKKKRVMWLAASVFYFHYGRLLL